MNINVTGDKSMIIPAIFILFFLINFLVGIFLIFKPASAIEIQRKFYALINWRIEPISMPKEIRSTRIMGLLLIIIMIAIFVLIFTNKVNIL